MAHVAIHSEDWKTLPWKKYQRNVYRLQKRIYRAARQGDWKRVHKLQRLLLRSRSAHCLAVRRVSQDNRGKHTPGVDGIASLTPRQRLTLAHRLRKLANWIVQPIRRTYIPKPGTTEKRGLGIPIMADRAGQALVKLAIEPEWEARFEPNSYGFRPGRSTHDAIEAIFNTICLKPKYALDADIEKCFDRISHTALLAKLNAIRPIQRLIHDWLKAGVMEDGQLLFPEAGTPQGGVISPLLANIALHGLEAELNGLSRQHRITVIRYADDLVILCADLATLLETRNYAEKWLAEMGLRFKESKTRLTHTLYPYENQVGFDFLGFNIRQYPAGKFRTRTYRRQPGFKTLIQPSDKSIQKHTETIRQVVHQYVGAPQAALITELNPIICGWTRYYRTGVAKRTFSKMDKRMSRQLTRWAQRRHPHKTSGWCWRRYWKHPNNRTNFSDGTNTLYSYADTPIVRHVKVRSDKSPFDGDWVYWAKRMGHSPTIPRQVTKLLTQQAGRCIHCGLHFGAEDVIETHHRDGNRKNNQPSNLAILHGHCHDQTHSKQYL